MKYSWKGHKDRNRHKNRTKRVSRMAVGAIGNSMVQTGRSLDDTARHGTSAWKGSRAVDLLPEPHWQSSSSNLTMELLPAFCLLLHAASHAMDMYTSPWHVNMHYKSNSSFVSHSLCLAPLAFFYDRAVMVVVAFSSLGRILGECSIIQLFFFFFWSGD